MQTDILLFSWAFRFFMIFAILFFVGLVFLAGVVPFSVRQEDLRLRLLGACAGGLVLSLSGLFFLVLPLRLDSVRPETHGVPGFLFDLLRLDLPYNMFPSLHVSLLLILLPIYTERRGPILQIVVTMWFALVGASTLLVWQHHVVDLVGGAVVR